MASNFFSYLRLLTVFRKADFTLVQVTPFILRKLEDILSIIDEDTPRGDLDLDCSLLLCVIVLEFRQQLLTRAGKDTGYLIAGFLRHTVTFRFMMSHKDTVLS